MRRIILIIWWIWVCEERASGWLVPCHSQFRGWKIPILIGDLERPIRYFKEIKWNHKLQVQATGISWTSQYQLVLPFISSFLTIFQLYGVRHTWWTIHLFGRFSCSIILYYDVNDMYLKLKNILGINYNIYHVLLSNIEETIPFPNTLL